MSRETRYLAAKALELLGLVVVGLALLVGLESDDMGRELTLLALGAGAFLIGWLVEPR